MVCVLLCSCEKTSKNVRRPSGFPEAASQIICPYCGEITSGIYKQDVGRFYFCFIPCCCTSKDTDTYMACVSCSRPLGCISGNKCSSCGLVTPFNCNNCPGCGARKQ